MSASPRPDVFTSWLRALEQRHLADLRVQEVTRALRALSSAYVQRRAGSSAGGAAPDALATTGKRAAFALFYAPLHFLTIKAIIETVGGLVPAPSRIIDVGCGTGAAGGACAITSGAVEVLGIDRHPWAVAEAQWTYRQLRLRGRARQADVTRLPSARAGTAFVAAYVLNELDDRARATMEARLLAAVDAGCPTLIVEPIARSVTPWWSAAAEVFVRRGGRADEWRFTLPLPALTRLLDDAAGLDHRVVTARSIYCPGRSQARDILT